MPVENPKDSWGTLHLSSGEQNHCPVHSSVELRLLCLLRWLVKMMQCTTLTFAEQTATCNWDKAIALILNSGVTRGVFCKTRILLLLIKCKTTTKIWQLYLERCTMCKWFALTDMHSVQSRFLMARTTKQKALCFNYISERTTLCSSVQSIFFIYIFAKTFFCSVWMLYSCVTGLLFCKLFFKH